MAERLKVYVAGPYSQPCPERNTARAIEVANQLLDLGHAPYIPHLSHYLHLARERSYEEWMVLDLEFLSVCDVLFRIPGHSPGADREVTAATAQGIPVVYRVEELERLCRRPALAG